MLEQQNCTFSKVEILDHNIGYVKFGAFPPPEICGPTVVAAMNFVAHTSALIFDLRENHGGSPDMVDFMVSYMFPHPTHINDLTNRHDNDTHQFWTLPWVPGSRFADQPVRNARSVVLGGVDVIHTELDSSAQHRHSLTMISGRPEHPGSGQLHRSEADAVHSDGAQGETVHNFDANQSAGRATDSASRSDRMPTKRTTTPLIFAVVSDFER